jgi:protein-disulfide isomerase
MSMKNKQLTKRERKELNQQEKQLEKIKRHHSRTTKKWIKIVAVTLVVLASISGIIWYGSSRPATPTNETLSLNSDDWVKGNKESKVILVEYLDFECEACGAYYPLVKRLSEEYGDRIAFTTRYFPLPGHRNSMTSASAVQSAGKQGKYWEMYDLVFQNQIEWGEKETPEPTIFEGYAQQLGLDMEKFRQDINSQEVKDRIERDKNTGNKLGIEGTPTFFLNGKRIENPRGYEEFKKVLDNALKN